jgi:hypothetical protein
LEFFEEKTFDSFYTLKEYPARDIGEYLHDCCLITTGICKNFWDNIKQYHLEDILPNDNIIQKYMSHLDGKPIEQYVLDEINKYKKRLLTKLKDNNSKGYEKLVTAVKIYNRTHRKGHLLLPNNNNFDCEVPPFPIMDIYIHIVMRLAFSLENKINFLLFNLVSQLGEIVNMEEIEDQEQLEDEILEGGRDYFLSNMLKDKKFIELLRYIKKDFDSGFKQFIYYHH